MLYNGCTWHCAVTKYNRCFNYSNLGAFVHDVPTVSSTGKTLATFAKSA